MKRLLPFLIALSFTGITCSRNPVGPPPSNGSDTTSHNWTFTIDTLGDGSGGSYLNDVAIVNTNPPIVYAVGQVYRIDSAGQTSPTLYNMAEWDGSGWELQRVPYNYQGQAFYGLINSILAFGPNDIWLGIGNLIHWNGSQYVPVEVGSAFNAYITKMWGTSDEDLYIVGENGSMAHFNGISWQSISTGTTEDIQDIWGGTDLITGKEFALATVSTLYYGGYSRLLKITGTQADTISTNGLSWSIRGVWFDSKGYYVVGAELYYKKTLQDSVWQTLQQSYYTTGYPEAIRGNAWNDIIGVGDFGTFLHYNGSTWHDFTQELNLHDCNLLAVSIKGNLAVAVGTLGGEKAIAVVAQRK